MKKHWPALLLSVIVIAFFLPNLARGEGFFYGDNLSQRIPTLTFWKQNILERKLPLWNPYILGGIPFFADLSNNVLAPTNFLYLFIPIHMGVTLITIFFVGIATLSTYYYVLLLTNKKFPSIFSAITFGLSGTVIAAVNDINSLQGIAFIPLVLLAAQHWINKNSLKSKILLIVIIALQFISSHPQYSYYTWILLFFYLLIFQQGKLLKRSLNTVLIFVIAFGLVAIQLLPFLELSNNVYRPSSKEFSSQNQVQIIELPRFVIANLYGSWREGSSWGPGSQLETGLANTEGYVGVLPLFFALIAGITFKSNQSRFWTIVALTSFILSLGTITPVYTILLKLLPLFSKFRTPARMLSLYSFSISILAGYGLSTISTKKKK